MQICREPIRGAFVGRPNRFTATIKVLKKDVFAYIPSSGKIDDLLVSGARCVLEPAEQESRKTSYDLISIESHDGRFVCIDTRIPQRFIEQSIRAHHLPTFRGYQVAGREVRCGESRVDLELRQNGTNAFVETRSVTRVADHVALYPDGAVPAETARIVDLTQEARRGARGYIVYIVQRNDADAFRPDVRADRDYVEALQRAVRAGVRVMAYRCLVTDMEIGMEGEIPVLL
ncbi:MAG: DNA/RNA nuclease SfsA [Acidobacteriota bacterium]|jgi:sugar fermentation stimulation protein A